MNELKMCPCGMVPSQIDIFAGRGGDEFIYEALI